jgi:hypothetical protein
MFHTKSVVKNVEWEMIYIEKIISPEAPCPSKIHKNNNAQSTVLQLQQEHL